MLSRVKIQNFQKHKSHELSFNPSLNIISGITDSGKSAVFRAIYWVCFNRPLGDSFRTYDSKKTAVTLEFSDDTKVKRVKTNSENYYELNGIKLAAMGAGVPEEVQKVLNLQSINFQAQFDPHFLLSQSSGEVARYLNSITKLDKIDSSIAWINKDVNNLKRESGQLTDDVKLSEEQLQKYDFIEQMETDVQECESLQKFKDSLEAKYYRLVEIDGKLVEIDGKINSLSWLKQASNQLEEIDMGLHTYEDKKQLQVNLARISQALNRVEEKEKQLKWLPEAKEQIEAIERQAKEYSLLENQVEDIITLQSKLVDIEQKINSANADMLQIGRDLDEMMPDVCPLCEQEIN